jgi:hypothetical protein
MNCPYSTVDDSDEDPPLLGFGTMASYERYSCGEPSSIAEAALSDSPTCL